MVLAYEQLLVVILRECNLRRNLMFILFLFISMAFLVVGSKWPKIYTSYSDIHIDKTNILQPLMKGAAVTTKAVDHVTNAKEIIFGDKILDKILSEANWLDEDISDIDKERIKAKMKTKVKIKRKGGSLLKITYSNSDSFQAYFVTKRLAELFIKEGEKSKIEESQSAYDFIHQQTELYLEKLTKVEEALREYRSNNPDARPGLENEVSSSITRIQREIESTSMTLKETNIKKVSILEQLSGEAAIAISHSREGIYRSKIANLQTKLETIRLDYKDTYPDILRLKHQIEDLKSSLSAEIKSRAVAKEKAKNIGKLYIDESIAINPLYQELRSNLSMTETQILTLKARMSGLNRNLAKEYNRAKKIFGGEAKLTKLTRDYEVNQNIYHDLLQRLENARVSKRLDEQQEGLSFKIQEPARIALLPTGARFLHFAIAGLLLATIIPIGLIYLLVQVDPRVRFSKVITSELNIPVLADITRHNTTAEKKRSKKEGLLLISGVILVLVVYSYISWIKFVGEL
ncbi:MAG: hypothetical protein QM504_08575 [Pseudomonadota bacterium]